LFVRAIELLAPVAVAAAGFLLKCPRAFV